MSDTGSQVSKLPIYKSRIAASELVGTEVPFMLMVSFIWSSSTSGHAIPKQQWRPEILLEYSARAQLSNAPSLSGSIALSREIRVVKVEITLTALHP